MASTFTSAKVAAGIQPETRGGINEISAEYEITAALVINDVVQMVKIPAGARIHDVTLATDDLESSGTASVVAVGDGDNDDRFITGSTIARAGGIERINAVDGVLYEYSAEDTIDFKCTTAPTTGATSGTIRLVVRYTMDTSI